MIETITESIRSEINLFEERLECALQSDIALIHQVARYLAGTKGKRFRPVLAILSARAVGAMSDRVIDAAVALELIHVASLIHDDIIDSSDRRRGVPTINKIWGDRISVLMGDFLFSRSLAILVALRSNRVMKTISETAERLSAGEILEIQMSMAQDVREETYFQMISDKSASLMSAACEVGAVLSRASSREVDRMGRFGETLGLAFQITDDLLDFVGDSDMLGKPVGIDIREKKVTLPLIRALSQSDNGESRRIRSMIEKESESPVDWQEIVGFVTRHKGVEYARKIARRYASSASEYIRDLGDSKAKTALRKVIHHAVERER